MRKSKLIFKSHLSGGDMARQMDNDPLTIDIHGDVFRSDIHLDKAGIVLSDTGNQKNFSISVRWQVDGFGFLHMPADRGGAGYQLPSHGAISLNLAYELLHTRIVRNRKRMERLLEHGGQPSTELRAIDALAQDLFQEAGGQLNAVEKCAAVSQKGLKYGLYASEMIEIEMARQRIRSSAKRPDFMFGCDTRGYFQMDKKLFLELFSGLFNYGTITHYLKGDFIDFEPAEDDLHFAERDQLLDELLRRAITIAGRPLFWTHTWVTPEWLKQKSYSQVLLYLEKHIKKVIRHYGDRIAIWEVVNELHDWANELELNHDQTIELTKIACNTAREVNPNIKLLINNCCPYAPYVQSGKWHDRPAKYPQRTPHQFTQQLLDAGVDFDLIGIQVYFVKRPLAETVAYIERYESFNKKLHLAEIGSPSRGITQEFNEPEKDFSGELFEWRRHWDEELQADWLEYIFTTGYSNPMVEAANWYDFVDPFGFLKSGGILRSPQGETKAAYHRLEKLKNEWLPGDSITGR